MKLYIKATTQTDAQKFLQVLKDYGIDTTKFQYELRAEKYSRNEKGPTYTRRFICPGDYIAFFSMYLHRGPTPQNLLDEMDIEEFQELVDTYPSIGQMAKEAKECWWGDRDDYIVYLKNLTTGKTLYNGETKAMRAKQRDNM